MQEQNNTTDSRNNDFLSYAEDICKKLESLEELSFEDQYFKDQSKALIKDFFLNNLYVFHRCLYLERTQKFKKIILSLYNNINLYHYTTYETLEKIITGKSLKLSRITDMNDKKECRALFDFYKTMYNDSNDKEKNKKEAFEKLYNYYTSKIFSFSFSALKDDAAQWERYGVKKGTNDMKEPCGICLEIPMSRLMSLIESIKERNDPQLQKNFDLVDIKPILYVPNFDNGNSMLDAVSKFAYLSNKNKEKKDLIKEMCQWSAAIKHESFKKEYEIRLLVALHQPDIVKINGSILLELDLPCYNFGNLFSSITLGPEVPKNMKEKVKELLKNNNIHIAPQNITFSNCPLHFLHNS